jgi:hypothetical protein
MHNQGISLLHTQLNKTATWVWLLLGQPHLDGRIPNAQTQGNGQAVEEMGLSYLVELRQGRYALPMMAWPEP